MPRLAEERIVAEPAKDHVILHAAMGGVAAVAAIEPVPAGLAQQDVVPRLAEDQVVARPGLDRIPPLAAESGAVSLAAADGVVAGMAAGEVAVEGGGDGVVPGEHQRRHARLVPGSDQPAERRAGDGDVVDEQEGVAHPRLHAQDPVMVPPVGTAPSKVRPVPLNWSETFTSAGPPGKGYGFGTMLVATNCVGRPVHRSDREG